MSKKNIWNELEEDVPKTGEFWVFHSTNAFFHGKIKRITNKFVVLEQATWVPATGRFSHFMKDPDGTTKEAEMLPSNHYIMVQRLIDFGKPIGQKPISTKERGV